ncbi:MAG TPA: Trk system potassium transporter TrkA [Cytophagales bacterium]|jgi:trk system potassium uptake protein TrkA|nr:Trk system potassium transporter TrkA [Cytophagales bacterium]
MRIIIAGAGEVGFHLAKLLAFERQDIVIIDMDQERLNYVANHLDISIVKGNSTSFKVLDDSGVAKSDLLIAVTSSEEANIATCVIAKNLGAKKTIARIDNLEFLLDKERFDLQTIGIDELISPESLAAREIKRLLKEAALTDTFDFDNGQLSLIGINIDKNGFLNNKTLRETNYLNPDQNFITVAILRNNQTIIPHGDTKFMANDHAYFIAEPDGVRKVMELSNREKVLFKNIMIVGGSKVGYHTARRLQNKYRIKLIDDSKFRCFELADMLEDVLVINGEVSDVDLLKEEGIEEMDAFIAVTNNSETNIISCLVAKQFGVAKTIALVENNDYIHLSQNIGVDTMINKKLIAANFISRYIRKGDIVSITGIHGVDAEIMEYEVKEKAKIVNKKIKDLHFPKSAIIGGVVREGQGYTTFGDFEIKTDDRVVILTKPEGIPQVESFFN